MAQVGHATMPRGDQGVKTMALEQPYSRLVHRLIKLAPGNRVFFYEKKNFEDLDQGGEDQELSFRIARRQSLMKVTKQGRNLRDASISNGNADDVESLIKGQFKLGHLQVLANIPYSQKYE